MIEIWGSGLADEPKFNYGFSKDLFVTRKPSGEGIIVGGTAQDKSRWTRVLSQRAAQVLWTHLARYLYPARKDLVAAVMTAPIRDSSLPTVTTHMVVEPLEGADGYQVVGWSGSIPVWRADLKNEDAQRLWALLDGTLYPKKDTKQ
jgi:hypothetical protein